MQGQCLFILGEVAKLEVFANRVQPECLLLTERSECREGEMSVSHGCLGDSMHDRCWGPLSA